MKAKFEADKAALAQRMAHKKASSPQMVAKSPPQDVVTQPAKSVVPQKIRAAAFASVKEVRMKADHAQTKMQKLAAKRNGVEKKYKAMQKEYAADKEENKALTEALLQEDSTI